MSRVFFDSHTHTNFSHDSKQDMEELILKSIDRGLLGIAITDHCELSDEEWDFCSFNIPLSLKNAAALKKKYSDKLKISIGLELGQEIYYKERCKEFLSSIKPDFILGTCHNLYKEEDYYSYNPQMDADKTMRKYFLGLLDIVEQAEMDSIAHLTYPIRYIQGIHGIPVHMERYTYIVDKILQTIIKREISMEINTSGYRQPLGFSMPDLDIVKRYKDYGGKLITLGSDSHLSKYLAHSFDLVIDELKTIGYKEYFYYEKRNAISIKI